MDKDELTELVKGTVAEAVSGDILEIMKDAVAKAFPPPKKGKKGGKAVVPAKGDDSDDDDDDDDDDTDGGDTSKKSTTDDETPVEKTELTPEEIEAEDAVKAQKKELKKARKAAEEATRSAALTKAIEEATAEVRNANAVLEARLATVEKMAAPSNIVKTRPVGAESKAAERDVVEMEIVRLENVSKSTTDADIRKGNNARIAELRNKINSIK